MKLSQTNFNLRSPDCYSVLSYLIATVSNVKTKKEISSNFVTLSENMAFIFGTLQPDKGYSLSAQRNILPINPKYDKRVFVELHVQYVQHQIFLKTCSNLKQSCVR